MDIFQELDEHINIHYGHSSSVVSVPEVSVEISCPMDITSILDARTREFCATNINTCINDDETTDQLETTECDISVKYVKGCGCSKNCLEQFDLEEIKKNIFFIRELSRQEKDMLILGALNKTVAEKSTKSDRKRLRYAYIFQGHSVCVQAFQFIFDLTKFTLSKLQEHLQKNGLTPRTHGGTGKRPSNAFTYDEIRNAVQFLINYADENGIPQPEASRGQDYIPVIFLPCSDMKYKIHLKYKESCEESEIRSLGLTSFKNLWLQCVPHIKICNPRCDVCGKCEIFRKQIVDAVTDNEKMDALDKFQNHLQQAKIEKEKYRKSITESIAEMNGVQRGYGPVEFCSVNLKKVHYTIDFSQQVQLPHHARQMGPVYFTVPRKVQLFGVRLDGINMQYNYIIDENETIGENGSLTHGPNAVISMIHHAFKNFGFGEKECVIHADNCGGQNKNRYVMAYFCWRVILGLHEKITYMMQIPGHARCLVDSNFAHIKRLYKRSDCDSLLELRDIVDKSSKSNTAVLYSEEDDWNWGNWKQFLERFFKSFPSIRKYQQFTFKRDQPGKVFAKESSADDSDIEIVLLKPNVSLPQGARPINIEPAGLTHQRQSYLYRCVRPYVRAQWKDTTCPPPGNEE